MITSIDNLQPPLDRMWEDPQQTFEPISGENLLSEALFA